MVTIAELKAKARAKKEANKILRPFGYKLKKDPIKAMKKRSASRRYRAKKRR